MAEQCFVCVHVLPVFTEGALNELLQSAYAKWEQDRSQIEALSPAVPNMMQEGLDRSSSFASSKYQEPLPRPSHQSIHDAETHLITMNVKLPTSDPCHMSGHRIHRRKAICPLPVSKRHQVIRLSLPVSSKHPGSGSTRRKKLDTSVHKRSGKWNLNQWLLDDIKST